MPVEIGDGGGGGVDGPPFRHLLVELRFETGGELEGVDEGRVDLGNFHDADPGKGSLIGKEDAFDGGDGLNSEVGEVLFEDIGFVKGSLQPEGKGEVPEVFVGLFDFSLLHRFGGLFPEGVESGFFVEFIDALVKKVVVITHIAINDFHDLVVVEVFNEGMGIIAADLGIDDSTTNIFRRYKMKRTFLPSIYKITGIATGSA